jgi:hypothetical protein
VRRLCALGFLAWIVIGLLLVSSAGAWPAGIDHSIFAEEPGSTDERPDPDLGDQGPDGEEDDKDDARVSRIIGVSLLGSGLFLCSWGISAWEVEEYQCCPAHNTGNVVKIVAGVVLLNAGLIYLLEADG